MADKPNLLDENLMSDLPKMHFGEVDESDDPELPDLSDDEILDDEDDEPDAVWIDMLGFDPRDLDSDEDEEAEDAAVRLVDRPDKVILRPPSPRPERVERILPNRVTVRDSKKNLAADNVIAFHGTRATALQSIRDNGILAHPNKHYHPIRFYQGERGASVAFRSRRAPYRDEFGIPYIRANPEWSAPPAAKENSLAQASKPAATPSNEKTPDENTNELSKIRQIQADWEDETPTRSGETLTIIGSPPPPKKNG